MDGLILFSHGSVLCGAGETLNRHAARLRERGGYAAVEVGYLNYSTPTFETAVERCTAAGVTRLIVVPYFLVPGKFVKVDLPKQVRAAQARRPEIEFLIADALGFDESLAEAILTLAENARPSEFWREDLARASQFCEADPRCPLYATPRCPRVPAPPILESVS